MESDMRTEHGITTPLGNFLYAFTDLLNNMADIARLQTMVIAKKSGYEGTVQAKPAQVVTTVIDDPREFDNQLKIMNGSADDIPGLVTCVSNIVNEFGIAVKDAAKANCDSKTTDEQVVSYWDCEKLTEARWRTEQALCKLNAKVVDLHAASKNVFAGVELRLCCPPHPCEDEGPYVYKAPVPESGASPTGGEAAPPPPEYKPPTGESGASPTGGEAAPPPPEYKPPTAKGKQSG
jgi:hypothetical protein